MLDEKTPSLDYLCNPLRKIPVEKTPFWSISIKRDLPEQVSQALEGLEGILNITDDILIYGVGDTEDEARRDHDLKLEALLLRCTERGIALNKNKLKLQITEVPFMGHLKSPSHLKSHGSPKEPKSRLHHLVPPTR